MNHNHEIFEKHYLDARRKELRLYSDEQVRSLPFVSPHATQDKEWKLRSKTTKRFQDYLQRKNFTRVLDLGCGNGWFTHQMAKSLPDSQIIGADINQTELEQARRCFASKNIDFKYLDVFDFQPSQKFDLITINAAIQYFENIDQLFQKIKTLLRGGGEFHILDSPIYSNKEAARAAKIRSQEYYTKIGNPELIERYFHHRWEDFEVFTTFYMPTANRLLTKLKADSPFPWLVYQHNV